MRAIERPIEYQKPMNHNPVNNRKESPAGSGKYVLIVGEDPRNLIFASILLQRLGYHICTAGSAEMALEMARAVVPKLIITDLRLPGMNAPQMIRSLRENEATAAVPIIIQLEQLVPQIVQKCLEAGAVACINKPVEPEELYRVVQATIEPKPREHIRIKTRLSVILDNTPLDFDAGEYAIMLSSRGMYVRTRTRYPVRTKFPITIDLIGRLIRAEAKVIYNHSEGEGPFGQPGMGLYFSDIAREDQKFLQQYINEEVTRGIIPGKTGVS